MLLAFVLSALIGFERETFQKPAGLRTHLLVALGAAAFTQASIYGFQAEARDPARLASNIVVGVGFLGAGTIWRSGSTVVGLTTAASIWVVAAIGVLAGAGLGWVAVFTTVLSWVVLRLLRTVEARLPDSLERLRGRRRGREEVSRVEGLSMERDAVSCPAPARLCP